MKSYWAAATLLRCRRRIGCKTPLGREVAEFEEVEDLEVIEELSEIEEIDDEFNLAPLDEVGSSTEISPLSQQYAPPQPAAPRAAL